MYPSKKTYMIIFSIIMLISFASGVNVEITSNPSRITAGGNSSINVITVNNTIVNFTTSLGNLSAASVLTDPSGLATITINSIVAGNATVNASVGTDHNTTNVTFLAGEPGRIDIDVSQNSLVVGNITIVNLTVYDRYNNVNSSVFLDLNISGTSLLGDPIYQNIIIAPRSMVEISINNTNITNSTGNITDNLSIILVINSTLAGNITLKAGAENIINNATIIYTPSAFYDFYITWDCDSQSCSREVNQTVIVNVQAFDIYGNPVNGTTFFFNATPPASTRYNSPIEYNSLNFTPAANITDLYGQIHTIFRTDKRAGNNNIYITAENLNKSYLITGLADDASDLLLTHTPDVAYANNKDKYTLEGQIVDQFRNPILPSSVPIKEQVYFSTLKGSTLVSLNEFGIASTPSGPTPYLETVNIEAIYYNETGRTNITNNTNLNFVGGNLSKFNIYANPEAVLSQKDKNGLILNGNHESSIILTALDEWGHPMPGINVTLNNTNTTLGNLTFAGKNDTNLINNITDANGKIYAFFKSNDSAGNATIIASNDSVNGSVTVAIRDSTFLSVNITYSPSIITSGGRVNVTTIISVEGELPLTRPAASAMLVLDRSGSMDPDYYAGSPLDVALVLDRSGSMKFDGLNPEQPMTDAKTAAKEFMNNLVSNSQVGVVSFSTSSSVDRGLTILNSYANKTLVRSAIDLIVADGSTAMGEGMADANTMLINGRPDAKKIMIVLTDGETNSGTDQEGLNAIVTANANSITIFSIGLGNSLNEPVLQNIANSTGGKYYKAPNSSDLANIYNSIAQEISDFDITQVQYGVDGFTPYNYRNQSYVNTGTIFEDSFLINETINDLKVQLDWINVSSDLNLSLISPGGHVYGAGNDTVGYYYNDGMTVLMNTTEYIWIHPLSYRYPDDDQDTVELGNWTVRVSGNRTEEFNITTFIDKKSAAKAASQAFISGFDLGVDKAGLVLYSDFNDFNRSFQTSYLGNRSMWLGYFKVLTDGIYYFNLSWNDSSNLNISLYNGAIILNSSLDNSNPKVVSALLSAGLENHLLVSRDGVMENDTQFTINVSSSPPMSSYTAMSAYYQSNSHRPRYRKWDGSQWSNEVSANDIGGNIRWTVMQSSPKRDEIILGTLDNNRDVNVLVWNGSSSIWNNMEVTASSSPEDRRGFDIANEENSGDAIIVYRGSSNSVPDYQEWNGTSWKTGSVNNTDAGSSIQWVRLAAKPNSDLMILATIDDSNKILAQIWNGSAWSNVKVLTTTAKTNSYQCFDIIYEQGTGYAIAVWAESNNSIMYSKWNGTSWNASSTIYTDTHSPYWVKLASDPESNNILMSVLNSDYEIKANVWNGSVWSTNQIIENSAPAKNKRTMDVSFEQSSGRGIVVWGDGTNTPKYRIWNVSWGPEGSVTNIGSDTQWVQLIPDPFSNKIFLMTSDISNDINIQQWNGSAWGSTTEVETSSSSSYESFDLAFRRQQNEQIILQTQVMWKELSAKVTSPLNNNTYLINSINTITADGLTAIDEGMYEANNEFSNVTGNSTIVLMTDGLDNTGYHSMLLEAQRAKDHNTTIYTIGLGANESEIDPILSDIANITGGKYYFAPNASVLKTIFRGIAANITNFTATGPTLNLDIPYNYITELSMATATYVTNSSNYTVGNSTYFIPPDAAIPNSNSTRHAEPNITTSEHITTLTWNNIPTLDPGDKWGVWYQLLVEGAGLVPLFLPSSNITYIDLNGTFITVTIEMTPSMNVDGTIASVNPFNLSELQLIADPPVVGIGQQSNIIIKARNSYGNANFNVTLDTNLGILNNSAQYYSNMSYITDYIVNYKSNIAGKALIKVIGSNPINNISGDVVIFVRPKGLITIS